MRSRNLRTCLISGVLVAMLGITSTSSCSAPGSKASLNTVDPLTVSPDKFRLLLENEHVRVVEYKLKPGEKDNWHTHPPKSSYVVSGGLLKIYSENGESFDAESATGTASWMGEVGRHFVENIGDTEVVIVLTEIKAH